MFATLAFNASVLARHLECDVEALAHPQLALHVAEVALPRVDRERCTHPRRKLPPVRVEVRDHDVARTRVADDRRRHAPDRPGARHEDVLAEHRERESGMHRVPERVEDRRHVLVDARTVVPDVRHRQRNELRERTGPIDAEPDRVRAEVPAAGHTVAATPADDVPLAADEVPLPEVAHVRADGDDVPDELVADDHRHLDRALRPVIPRVNVEVGPTDSRLVDPDQHVVDTDLRFRDLLEPEPRLRLSLHQRQHSFRLQLSRSVPPRY